MYIYMYVAQLISTQGVVPAFSDVNYPPPRSALSAAPMDDTQRYTNRRERKYACECRACFYVLAAYIILLLFARTIQAAAHRNNKLILAA